MEAHRALASVLAAPLTTVTRGFILTAMMPALVADLKTVMRPSCGFRQPTWQSLRSAEAQARAHFAAGCAALRRRRVQPWVMRQFELAGQRLLDQPFVPEPRLGDLHLHLVGVGLSALFREAALDDATLA